MSKIEQNREKKRQAILKAAKDSFLSGGYVEAKMDQIAADAGVTKQTVYRYYPSKIDLFKATLEQMSKQEEFGFLTSLDDADTETALLQFAKGFIQAHLSDEHLATYRLLIAEGSKAPEIMQSFRSVGPDETDQKLTAFLSQRLGIDNAESVANLWTSMLLAQRGGVLMGMDKPTERQIEQHAKDSIAFLLNSIR